MSTKPINRRTLLKGAAGATAAVAIGGGIVSKTSAFQTPASTGGGGTIMTAISTEPIGIDPCNPWNLGSGLSGINQLVYDPWTRYDRNFTLQPNLAKSWTRVDETTVEFELQAGAKFHESGREMTTDDVVKTAARYTDAALGCSGAGIYTTQVASLTPTDASKFQVKLTQPNLLVQRIPLPIVADPDYVAANAKPLMLHAEAGTGPWILDKWETGTSISFKRNPTYWGTAPVLDAFQIQIIEDESTAVAALQSGQLNYLPFSSYDSYDLLKDDSNVTIYSQPGFSYVRLNVNHLRPALQDPNVLQALRFGLNRQQLVDTLTEGLGKVSGPLSPANEFYALPVDQLADLQKYDPDQAKALLAKSGYSDSNHLKLVCLSIAGFKNYTDIAQVVAANLQEIWIDLEIRIQETGVWVDSRLKTKDYDLSVNDYGVGIDPDYTFYRSDQDEQSWTGGGDPALDNLINQSNSEDDATKRQAIVYQIQQMLIENVRELYLYAPPFFEAVSTSIQGYTPFPGGSDLTTFARDGVTVKS